MNFKSPSQGNRRNIYKWVIAAITVTSLSALDKANADIIITDNLANNASQISGLKNAVNTSYYQGFSPSVSGEFNSLEMDLALQQINNLPPPTTPPPQTSYDTLSIYLYTANSSGVPQTLVSTLATGITVANIESTGTELPGGQAPTADSFIYQYTVNLSGNTPITANADYAIEVSFSGPGQEIGWAEESGSDPKPAGEVGKLAQVGGGNAVGYGRVELDMTSVPEASTFLPGLMCCGLLVVGQGLKTYRRKSLSRA